MCERNDESFLRSFYDNYVEGESSQDQTLGPARLCGRRNRSKWNNVFFEQVERYINGPLKLGAEPCALILVPCCGFNCFF